MILLGGVYTDETDRPESFQGERIPVGDRNAFVVTAVKMRFLSSVSVTGIERLSDEAAE